MCIRDSYLSAAAVGDMEFEVDQHKIKKSELNGKLLFKPSVDILEKCLETKKEHQLIIGFAAETQLNFSTLQKKWERKKVDFLIGTRVHSSTGQGFAASKAEYHILKDGQTWKKSHFEKSKLYNEVFGEIFR